MCMPKRRRYKSFKFIGRAPARQAGVETDEVTFNSRSLCGISGPRLVSDEVRRAVIVIMTRASETSSQKKKTTRRIRETSVLVIDMVFQRLPELTQAGGDSERCRIFRHGYLP